VKGAFTGATSDKIGAAQLADGGTLFLDEICEMSPHLQTKLLRFIQTGTFNPVGKAETVKVDTRFICATNRNPLDEVAAGRFREDLYYRLHVIPISMPALRERDEDVVRIAEGFLHEYAREEGKELTSFSENARGALMRYDWPGNVRQLQNIVRHAVVFGEGTEVTSSMLREPIGKAAGTPAAPIVVSSPSPTSEAAPNPGDLNALAAAIRPLDDVEREAIERAVGLCAGDVRKAAVFLGVSPATIYRKQKSWREASG
jgi:DNA-binding NtrC family response regulator